MNNRLPKPREHRISDKVTATVGLPDGSVQIGIKVPIIGTVNVTIEARDLPQAAQVLQEAMEHLEALASLAKRARKTGDF